MSQDISGFGTVVTLVASVTYPQGITITQFADDTDPIAIGAIAIRDIAMGLNGDLVTWAKAVPLPAILAVIPGSENDIDLQILFDANRVAQGKFSARDVITLNVIYPDGTFFSLILGVCINGEFGNSISSAGRKKTKVYGFAFQDKIGG